MPPFALGLLLAATVLPCTLTLDAPRAYRTNYVATVDDFDGDGRPDVLMWGYNAIAVRYGRGDGTLGEPVLVQNVPALGGVKAGDLDGDGRTDVISRQHILDAGAAIFVHRNLGNREFAPPVELLRTDAPFWVGDFITGGGEDVLAGGMIHASDGRKIALSLGRPLLRIVTSGDFDGDGHLDLAGTEGDSVVFLHGEGNGRFPTARVMHSGATTWDIAVADFNGDGRDDAAVSNYGGSSVSLFFDPFHAAPTALESGENPMTMLARDLDRDGDADLAVYETASNVGSKVAQGLAIYRNDGRGGFTRIDRIPAASPLGAGDFDGDGAIDLLAAAGSDASAVIRGRGDGTFDAPPLLRSFVPYAQLRRAADLDGDGIDELILTAYGALRLQAFVGRFGKPPELLPSAEIIAALDAGDLTDDPGLEIAALVQTHVVVFGYAGGRWVERRSFGAHEFPYDIVVRDFTGDGTAEIAYLYGARREHRLRVTTADGIILHDVAVGPSQTLRLLPLDADRDGLTDLLVGGSGTWPAVLHQYTPDANGYLAVLRGIGGGRFAPEVRIVNGVALKAPVAGDFNGDGADDVAVGTWTGDDQLLRIPNNGDGTFGAAEALDFSGFRSYSIELAAGDLDADGTDELVAVVNGAQVLLFEGLRGRGAFLGSSGGGVAIARTRERAMPSIVMPVPRSGEILAIDPACVRPRRRAV